MFRAWQENSHVVLSLIRALERGWGGTEGSVQTPARRNGQGSSAWSLAA